LRLPVIEEPNLGVLEVGFIWSAASGEGTVNALTRDANRILTVPLVSDDIRADGISYSPDGLHLLVTAEAIGISALTVLSAAAE